MFVPFIYLMFNRFSIQFWILLNRKSIDNRVNTWTKNWIDNYAENWTDIWLDEINDKNKPCILRTISFSICFSFHTKDPFCTNLYIHLVYFLTLFATVGHEKMVYIGYMFHLQFRAYSHIPAYRPSGYT